MGDIKDKDQRLPNLPNIGFFGKIRSLISVADLSSNFAAWVSFTFNSLIVGFIGMSPYAVPSFKAKEKTPSALAI